MIARLPADAGASPFLWIVYSNLQSSFALSICWKVLHRRERAGHFELHRPNFLSLALPKETALARIWDEIHEQHAEADRLNAKYGVRFHIFKASNQIYLRTAR